jgi:hypothetical protein
MRFKKGQVREDGMVFWGYCGKCPDGSEFPYWVTKAEYASMDQKTKERNRLAYLVNREKRIAQAKAYAEKNKEKISWRGRIYRQKNAGRIRDAKRLYARMNGAKIAAYLRKRRAENPVVRLSNSMRRAVRRYLSAKEKGSLRSQQIVGCSKEHLVRHLESKFRDGMLWENYGSFWEVDHIIPLSSAKDADEVIRLCHWTNLQPLTCSENRAKADRVDGLFV